MRTILVLLVCGAMLGGCSGLQTKGTMTTQMGLDAQAAQPVYNAATASPVTLTASDARLYIPVGAKALQSYYATATWFAPSYWFGTKLIFADAVTLLDLETCANLSVENTNRAPPTSPKALTDAAAITIAKDEAKEVIRLNARRLSLP